jgi:8-oxo-dGTP pyrophosphatase MutT (NUDIX family)
MAELAGRAPFRFPEDAFPAHFRRSAVLIAFWEEAGDVRVVFTRRSSRMSRHAGQVSFPGGLLEGDEDFEQAAVREAYEEVGIQPEGVEVMGRLDDAWSGAGSHLVPVVGWLSSRPAFEASAAEVAEILTPRVSGLLSSQALGEEEVFHRGMRYVNPIVSWPGGRAYGLSADLLLEALEWGGGGCLERGPGRLAELRSYYSDPVADPAADLEEPGR